MNLEYIVCPICDEDYAEHLFVDNLFNLVKCGRCGLVYVNPRPSETELKGIYSDITADTGAPLSFPRGLSGYTDFGIVRTQKARMMSRVISKYKKRGKILDVGCAAGYFLKVMKERGYEVRGVEVSKIFADFAKNSYGLSVFCGDVNQARFANENFDIVTMFDVLSHLRTPSKDLKEINRILKVGGLLILETGNKGEFRSKESVEKWSDSWGSPEHLFHYSKKALMILLQKTGFAVLEIDTYPMFPSILIERILLKIVGRSPGFQREFSAGSLDLKRYLMILCSYAYLFLKYQPCNLLKNLNVDSTMVLCCKKC
ncbi:MAG: class I SAM-dependent methyltransferase [Candidatus Bathyarchaeota archaeon]|nr:class I SAM-dependent methyltransferase [Candidatus Bathyarchaeota archaeon]